MDADIKDFIESKFEVVNSKLTVIETQTTKTNGRVTRLEDKVVDMDKEISKNARYTNLFNKIMEKVMMVVVGAIVMYFIDKIR